MNDWGGITCIDPGHGNDKEVLNVHSHSYITALQKASISPRSLELEESWTYGLAGDTPPYVGIYEAAREVLHASVRAAEAINDGYDLAFNMAGGLHHAQADRASGFCALSDIAAAIEVLKRKHKYIAYVDIDLHHGDGPQKIYEDDPDVLTASIHQYGRGFYPGTGSLDESSIDKSIINVPLLPNTGSDTWSYGINNIIIPSLVEFDPQVIVLQIGADAHHGDPLGGLRVNSSAWIKAVHDIVGLNKPTIVLAGGGYDIDQTSLLWAATCWTLLGNELPDSVKQEIEQDQYGDDPSAQMGNMLSVCQKLQPIIKGFGTEEDDY